jgi:8-oxo-dGTP diphosphatase
MHPPKNPFESGSQKAIPAVLVYVRQRDQILMIHRNSKVPGRVDYHEGKWNGLGGKCEFGESPIEAAKREIQEESGLILTSDQLKPLGVIQFPNFKPKKNEDWIVFVFFAELNPSDKQRPHKTSEEGDLHWIPASDLLSLNLWPGDHYFIPYILEQKPFLGTIWYEENQVFKTWFQGLG